MEKKKFSILLFSVLVTEIAIRHMVDQKVKRSVEGNMGHYR